MNINSVKLSFGCTSCPAPGKKRIHDHNYNPANYGRCPVPGRDETPIKPYDLELMGVDCSGNEKLTIEVVDKDDEVIQSHLDAIAQRNIALMNINED